MQFKAFAPGVEVRGIGLQWMVSGFRILPETGLRYLAKYGLTRVGPDGKQFLDLDAWYPQDRWLACVEAMTRDIGENVMREMGHKVGLNVPMPPNIDEIDAGLAAIDVSYHMFHRRDGRPMFDEKTGRKLDGIGRYEVRPGATKNARILFCETPYSCDFDIGLAHGFAERFQRLVKVQHDRTASCRKSGADNCTYVVSWA